MRAKKTKAQVKFIRDKYDDYYQTILGLIAFSISAIWDDVERRNRQDATWCMPRKMAFEHPEPGDPDIITPDGVIQVSGSYGIVAEMKKHFPTGEADRNDTFKQCAKYARRLKGWWTTTELIEGHDVVLLTHLVSGQDAADAFSVWTAAGGEIGCPFAIVEFGWTEQGQKWFWLKKHAGALSDSTHDGLLHRGKKLPEEVVLQAMATGRFTDSPPPLAYTLVAIWANALPQFIDENVAVASRGKRLLDVTVDDIRAKLQELYPSPGADMRAMQLPRKEWITDACDALVKCGLASRLDRTLGRYRIEFRQIRTRDLLEYFANRLTDTDLGPEGRQMDDQQSLFK